MVQELQSRVDKIDGFYTALKTNKADLESQLISIKDEIELLTKTSAVIKHLLDIMVKDEIGRMAGLVTYGLKAIFDDQNLSFVPVITKKNDKVNIEFRTENNGVSGDFGSFGGSVAVIESFLLRLLCMLKLKLARFMVLDETFAAVGEEYIQNTSKLVNELSKKTGLDVLLVTHQKEFQNSAQHIYRVKEAPEGLKIETIKSTHD